MLNVQLELNCKMRSALEYKLTTFTKNSRNMKTENSLTIYFM